MSEVELSEIDFKKITLKAKELAKKNVEDMCLPEVVVLPKNVNSLGQKINERYRDLLQRTANGSDENELSIKLAKIIKFYWFICHESANDMRLQLSAFGYKELNQTQKQVTTGHGYANREGWAYTFYNGLGQLPCELNASDSLVFMALYWFSLAEKVKGSENRYNHLAEAFYALELANGDTMFEAGVECKSEEFSEQRRKAAQIGHSEHYALKRDAIEYWCKNIGLDVSNDQAAKILLDVVPLSFRTLSEYVSEAKRKNIHPASKE